jgi:hypothetical protein
MRENLLDRQEFQSHQVKLRSNGNASAMLFLSGQGYLEIVTRVADSYGSADNPQERRGCDTNVHLKDDTNECVPSKR